LSDAINQLKVTNLTVFRSDIPLFKSLSFSIKSGQAIQLSGTNGIGKTSLLRCLCGLSQRHEGSIHWNDISLTESQTNYYQQLLYLGHSLGLKPKLSVEQNLHFYQTLRYPQVSQNTKDILEVLKLLNIEAYFDEPVGNLSAGQKRRVALARLILEPVALWVLDEPMVALDSFGQAWLETVCNRHLKEGGMIILTSHQKLIGINGLKEVELQAAQFYFEPLDTNNGSDDMNDEERIKEANSRKSISYHD
jgi:heme exporter protein A